MIRSLNAAAGLGLWACMGIMASGSLASAQTQPAGSQPATTPASAPAAELTDDLLSGLKFRSIGPALMSGRIGDLAVHPENRAVFYAATASGGLWKTENAGTTWSPIFDGQGSYSIGCVTLDPRNPSVVWVGTGENNSQRSVGWGDGVYRSRDGGASWEHLGLKDSEHIGKIVVHPHDSNTVYVAAQGPLWRGGNERGLYKTTNGGKTWTRILHVSDDTGINEVHMDPRDPNTLYASAYQRRRHVWTLINGGPESALYKSEDGGESWRKIHSGLPGVDLGRIGLAISPANPDILYAIVEAAQDKSGVFRSTNRGETWEKRSSYISQSPQYYNELVPHPTDPQRVYSLDTMLHETRDGGATFTAVSNTNRHVDDHALWIDPRDTRYMIVGCDGGIYESFDEGVNWRFMPNLPITQFYRVAIDNALPFYNVYGGTQDNFTLGGPSRTTERVGIVNGDWFTTVGGDGFEPAVDPEDPNIVYSQWQYGGLIRYDRRSGELVDIKPRERAGDAPYRFNWDSPLLISQHNRKRLYFAAQRIFRSDDQGDSWSVISEDLTRQLDRNQLKVMGRIQPADAVAKSDSTSFYGNIVSLSESPLEPGLLYAGTDDGLIQVTEDGGKTWRKIDTFPGVPELAYVSAVRACMHDANVVYASFDAHKLGDFTPYLLRSADRGNTWTSIAGNLERPHVVLSIAQDHVRSDILFCGTEFGCYVTLDGGQKWRRLKAGLPTIPVRDIEVHRRENDLVLATFGRGFYILDDYSALRELTPERLSQTASILPIKPALRYIERNRLGMRNGKGFQGANYYAASNPAFGATFTYYLKDKYQTLREKRHERESKSMKEGTVAPYPTLDELRAEDAEKAPAVMLVVKNAAGETIRRIGASREKGVHRASWDLRYPSARPTSLGSWDDFWEDAPSGMLALPGGYTVELVLETGGQTQNLAGPVKFEVTALETATFAAQNKQEALAFKQKFARLQRAAEGAARAAEDLQRRLDLMQRALIDTPAADLALLSELQSLRTQTRAIVIALSGDSTAASRNEPASPSILDRIGNVVGGLWYVTSAPTQTQRDAYKLAGEQFSDVLGKLRTLIDKDVRAFESKLEKAGAPYTPGRLPDWSME